MVQPHYLPLECPPRAQGFVLREKTQPDKGGGFSGQGSMWVVGPDKGGFSGQGSMWAVGPEGPLSSEGGEGRR